MTFLSNIVELELFPLNENKDLFTHRLLQPFATTRDIEHNYHRMFIGTEQWRLKKSNIQTIAGRSFKLTQNKFEKELTKVVHYLQYNFYTPDWGPVDPLDANAVNQREADIRSYSFKTARIKSKKIFHDYYKRAYFLGLKSSGAGISQSYSQLLFKDSADPLMYKEEERWSQTAATAEMKFWGKFLGDISRGSAFRMSMEKRIKLYSQSLEGHYNAGRVAGAPNHSVVHWTLTRGHDTCPECEWLASNSPWPKELMVTTPKAGMCSCLMNCRCSLKIVPMTQAEYKTIQVGKPSRAQVVRKIKGRSL
jgi:hypothetical protein